MQAAPTSIAPARERAEALGDERRRVRDSGVRGRGREQDQVDVARVDAGARERALRGVGGDIGQGHLGRSVAALEDSRPRLDPVAIDAEPRADRVVGNHPLGQRGGDRGDAGGGDRRGGQVTVAVAARGVARLGTGCLLVGLDLDVIEDPRHELREHPPRADVVEPPRPRRVQAAHHPGPAHRLGQRRDQLLAGIVGKRRAPSRMRSPLPRSGRSRSRTGTPRTARRRAPCLASGRRR